MYKSIYKNKYIRSNDFYIVFGHWHCSNLYGDDLNENIHHFFK